MKENSRISVFEMKFYNFIKVHIFWDVWDVLVDPWFKSELQKIMDLREPKMKVGESQSEFKKRRLNSRKKARKKMKWFNLCKRPILIIIGHVILAVVVILAPLLFLMHPYIELRNIISPCSIFVISVFIVLTTVYPCILQRLRIKKVSKLDIRMCR